MSLTLLYLFFVLLFTGAVADRYRIHSQLSGTLAILTAFIQCFLLLTPSALHQTIQDCIMNSSFPTNVTSPRNMTSFPVDVMSDHTISSNCLLHCCDISSKFILDCENSLTKNLTNISLNVQWNCSISTETSTQFSKDIPCDTYIHTYNCKFI